MHATLAADVFAENQHAGIDLQLVLERAPYRGHQVDARTLRLGALGARRRHDASAAQPALLLQIDRAVSARLGKRVALNALRIRSRAPLDIDQRLRDQRASCRDFEIPVGLREGMGYKLLAQLRQRIAGVFSRDFLGGLVGLRILSGVSRQPRDHEPDQRRTIAGSDAGNRIFNQGRRGQRIGSIAVEHAQSSKTFEIARDVAARGLLPRAD